MFKKHFNNALTRIHNWLSRHIEPPRPASPPDQPSVDFLIDLIDNNKLRHRGILMEAETPGGISEPAQMMLHTIEIETENTAVLTPNESSFLPTLSLPAKMLKVKSRNTSGEIVTERTPILPECIVVMQPSAIRKAQPYNELVEVLYGVTEGCLLVLVDKAGSYSELEWQDAILFDESGFRLDRARLSGCRVYLGGRKCGSGGRSEIPRIPKWMRKLKPLKKEKVVVCMEGEEVQGRGSIICGDGSGQQGVSERPERPS